MLVYFQSQIDINPSSAGFSRGKDPNLVITAPADVHYLKQCRFVSDWTHINE